MGKIDEFDSAGEAFGYISLDQAVLMAMQLAREDDIRHKQRGGWDEIAWVEKNSQQREDSYRVELWFWNPALGPQLQSLEQRD